MSSVDSAAIVSEIGPVIGLVAVIVGTLLGGWLQARIGKDQSIREHQNQLRLLKEAHEQNLTLLQLQAKRDEDTRLRQFAESDRADRLVVLEYIDLLLPRLIEVASIEYLGPDNKNATELSRYRNLQKFMNQTVADPAHPEKNLGLRMAFLIFQLIAAMRIALNARWTRPLTDEQSSFLSHWESHIEPMICSGRYPGKELLYREQVEIVTEELLTVDGALKCARPINWKEFCDKRISSNTLQDLSNIVSEKLRYIFVESNALPPKKAMQCRLGIMALYLIQLSKEAGNDTWTWREENIWRIVCDWYAWESRENQNPKWFVLKYGDVAERLDRMNVHGAD